MDKPHKPHIRAWLLFAGYVLSHCIANAPAPSAPPPTPCHSHAVGKAPSPPPTSMYFPFAALPSTDTCHQAIDSLIQDAYPASDPMHLASQVRSKWEQYSAEDHVSWSYAVTDLSRVIATIAASRQLQLNDAQCNALLGAIAETQEHVLAMQPPSSSGPSVFIGTSVILCSLLLSLKTRPFHTSPRTFGPYPSAKVPLFVITVVASCYCCCCCFQGHIVNFSRQASSTPRCQEGAMRHAESTPKMHHASLLMRGCPWLRGFHIFPCAHSTPWLP